MDAYSNIRGGKLSLKTKSGKSLKKSTKRKSQADTPSATSSELDAIRHGEWWAVEKSAEVVGPIALEFEDMRYLKSLDNGSFELGNSHSAGESPDEEEMVLAMKISGTNRFSFKTGFGKFIGIDSSNNRLVATADAIGPLESWEVLVKNEGEVCYLSNVNGFLCRQPEGIFGCVKSQDDVSSVLKIRSCAPRKVDPKAHLPKEERGGVRQTEINYVKSFSGLKAEKRLKLSSEEKSKLRNSRNEGTFHEALLDRREKIKSDKFCK